MWQIVTLLVGESIKDELEIESSCLLQASFFDGAVKRLFHLQEEHNKCTI